MRCKLLLPFLIVATTLLLRARPAHACDPAELLSAFDFFDRATTVVLIDQPTIATGRKVTADVVETLKGSAGATIAFTDSGGTCEAVVAGVRGMVFLDATGHAIGLYDGFVVDPLMIDAVRRYGKATTAAERAAPILEVALGRAWSASFMSARALAERVDLVLALDAKARAAIIARLAKIRREHPLILVGARLHDPRVAAVHRRRKFSDVDGLAGVLAGTMAAETDVARLAAVIEVGKRTADRVAALEQCEQVWTRSLARFTVYALEPGDDATWARRAEACRTGNPVP